MSSELQKIVEGVLFASDRPLSIDDILNLFGEEDRPDRKVIKSVITELQAEYESRGINLKELASGYQFQTHGEISNWVSRLWEDRAPRYSRALLETLALVAYRQPITRGEVEEIRGVAVSTNIMRTLIEREWVKVVGHKEVPGRPSLYATTKEFLDYFGLKRLEDLPPLTELVDLDEAGKKLEASLHAEQAEALAEEQAQASEDLGLEQDEEEIVELDDAELEAAMAFAKQYDVDSVINPEADEEGDEDELGENGDEDQVNNEKLHSEA